MPVLIKELISGSGSFLHPGRVVETAAAGPARSGAAIAGSEDTVLRPKRRGTPFGGEASQPAAPPKDLARLLRRTATVQVQQGSVEPESGRKSRPTNKLVFEAPSALDLSRQGIMVGRK
jgi:hypothetical protein